MSWRVNRSLKHLMRQVNEAGPYRNKSYDGTIGDTAHSKRKSDHNPDGNGVVNAVDITDDDTAPGFDATALFEALIKSKDKRIKYLIHNGYIVRSYAKGSLKAWSRQKYTRPNGHFKHVHVSVHPSADRDVSDWAMPGDKVPTNVVEKVYYGPLTLKFNPDGRQLPYRVEAGTRLNQGDHLTNGNYRLAFTHTGRLSLIRINKEKWAKGHGDQCVFQKDGNFVLYRDKAVVWETKTANSGAKYLELVADGNILIRHEDGEVLWSSETYGEK